MPASRAVEQGGADRGLGSGCLVGSGRCHWLTETVLPSSHTPTKCHRHAVPLLGVLWASASEVSRGLRPACCFLSADLCACSPGNKESVALTEAGAGPCPHPHPCPQPRCLGNGALSWNMTECITFAPLQFFEGLLSVILLICS